MSRESKVFSHATSSNACGFRAAIRSRVRAAPEGARRPCSQSCSVRTETPSNWANRAWDRPVFSLVSAMSGTFRTRPYSARLISRRPCRISAPILRFVIFHLVADLSQNVRGNVGPDILGVKRQHPDDPFFLLQEVDHTKPAAFASPRRSPTQLADSAATRNDSSSVR